MAKRRPDEQQADTRRRAGLRRPISPSQKTCTEAVRRICEGGLNLDFKQFGCPEAGIGGFPALPRSRPTSKLDHRPWVTASAFLAWTTNGRFRRNRRAASHSSLGFSRFRCMSGSSPVESFTARNPMTSDAAQLTATYP